MNNGRFGELLASSPYSYTCPVEKLTEDYFDSIFEKIGGIRIAEGDDRTADYKIGNIVLELKFLEKEGSHSSVRQNKLAGLFKPTQPNRPVVVLDDNLLDDQGKHIFRQIYKGTIHGHIRKAKQQLKESRLAHPDTNCSILFFHNIGFASMDHAELFELIKNRVRNDTSTIDGVVVTGSYTISDGFNVEAFMNFNYEPISSIGHEIKPTTDKIHSALFASQMKDLTSSMRGEVVPSIEVDPLTDIVFDLDGVRYVRPAPLLSSDISMFPQGRTRIKAEPKDSGVESNRPRILPKLTREQWVDLVKDGAVLDGESFDEWTAIQNSRLKLSTPLSPIVAKGIDLRDYKRWCIKENHSPLLYQSLSQYAVILFDEAFKNILHDRKLFVSDGVRPQHYLLVCTEFIGQNESNDISHIFHATEAGTENPIVAEIVTDIRICQDEALVIAAINAVALGLDSVFYYENKKYGWV